MKRILSDREALQKILMAQLPERTKTYTPIQHSDIIFQVRKCLRKAQFKIQNEQYSSSANGEVALVTFHISNLEDPDLMLAVSFINSYNKEFRFQFCMGAICKVSMSAMFTTNADLGLFKRKHSGVADLEAEDKVEQIIKSADTLWHVICDAKNSMKKLTISKDEQHEILGRLIFHHKALNTLQINTIIRLSERKVPLFDFGLPEDNAWVFYNRITHALKESHPGDWLRHHEIVHDVFESRIPGWLGKIHIKLTPEQDTLMRFPGRASEAAHLEPELGFSIVQDPPVKAIETIVQQDSRMFAKASPEEAFAYLSENDSL